MRRWGVFLYGPLIMGQGVLAASGWIPIATTALILQTVIWVIGLTHIRKMI
jgi:hypothetical protein